MSNDYKKYKVLSDIELIDLILTKDTVAVEYLLNIRCARAFKRLCQTYPKSGLEVHELIGEIYLKMYRDDWRFLRNFKGTNEKTNQSCKLTTYIVTCAARWIKRKNAKALSEIDWTSALSNCEGDWIDAIDQKCEKDWLKLEILDAIMALENPKERLVLLEYKIRGRSPSEVAKMLTAHTTSEGTIGNVYKICSRGIKNLRCLLEKGGNYA